MAEGRRFYFFNPPPPLSWGERFERTVRAVTSHSACALFLAISAAVFTGLWFSSGDLWIMIPAAVFGILFGIAGWCFAPISRAAKGIWIATTGALFVMVTICLYAHYHPNWHPLKLETEQSVPSPHNRVKPKAAPRRAPTAPSPRPVATASIPVPLPKPNSFMHRRQIEPPPTESRATPIAPPPPAMSAEHARIVVTHFQVVPVNPSDSNSDFQINVYFINRGQTFGYAPRITSKPTFFDHDPASDETSPIVTKNTEDSYSQSPSRGQQLEVGEEHWITLPWTIKKSDWDKVTAGRQIFALAIAMAFADDATPQGHFWISEWCGVQGRDTSYIGIRAERTFYH
jgi:hypothetical protein